MYNPLAQTVGLFGNLSGWMRLWLVVSAAWIVSIMYIGYLWFPSDAQLKNEIYSRYADDFRKLDSEFDQQRAICARLSGIEKVAEMMKCAIESNSIKQKRSELAEEVLKQADLESQYFWKSQTAVVAKALALGILPPILVLFLGTWVLKGFLKRS